ncbi:hypothetical protein D9619_010441 [Psilocybe cf. subviscida]|uniref:HAT C-terminal dimerisation domain-containing protein n=1 Tax=Psilocybe cf. subviscida TaxID=2480587 RepID=A0A8H5ERS2_9AGAR|nr:hypothetical protein D9619_010441 [Psilocybe cf. subviscida]
MGRGSEGAAPGGVRVLATGLTNANWDDLLLIRNILWIPHAFQQLLSGKKTPTLCGVIPAFELFVKSWKELQQTEKDAINIIQGGLDKLQVYSNRAKAVPAYTVAMILNPQIKLDYYKDHAPLQVSTARALFLREVRPYFDTIQRQRSISAAVSSQIEGICEPEPVQNIYPKGTPRRICCQHAIQETSEQSPAEILGLAASSSTSSLNSTTGNSLKEELQSYLNDTSGKDCIDILAYWQENQLKFPVLFHASLDYLAIQASSVPCEWVFSSAKETMTTWRSHICLELMEALQMLKFSLNHRQGLNFSRGAAQNLREELEEYLQSIGPDT